MQLVFKEEIKEYLEFDETRHVIKLVNIPSDSPLKEYNKEGVLDVAKIFTKFLEQIHKSVDNLSKNTNLMESFGIASMTVDWKPCKGKNYLMISLVSFDLLLHGCLIKKKF